MNKNKIMIFKIIGLSRHNDLDMDGGCWQGGKNDATINGKEVYMRILIKKINKLHKKILIIGNSNAITYKEIFPYLKDNQLWLGMNWVKEFIQPNGEIKKFGNICWFTNIINPKRNKPLDLYRKYNPTDYPKYDNYDAINVDKITDIPEDYDGVMGVPITFLDKYCPTQFEMLGHEHDVDGNGTSVNQFELNGKGVYKRLLIKKVSYYGNNVELIEDDEKENKKFLIIGNKNAITYKEIFPYIKNNELWLGLNSPCDFSTPSGEITKTIAGLCRWFTNIENQKRTTPLDLYRKYNPTDYPKYDNYDAINVDKVTDIPEDYDDVMGVPITFLDKYCPKQFEIVKGGKGYDDKYLSVNGYTPYFRILIRKIK